MEAAGLPRYNNRWNVVFDFTEHFEEGVKIENYSCLPPQEFTIEIVQIEGEEREAVSLPQPQAYGGELPDNDLTA